MALEINGVMKNTEEIHLFQVEYTEKKTGHRRCIYIYIYI